MVIVNEIPVHSKVPIDIFAKTSGAVESAPMSGVNISPTTPWCPSRIITITSFINNTISVHQYLIVADKNITNTIITITSFINNTILVQQYLISADKKINKIPGSSN